MSKAWTPGDDEKLVQLANAGLRRVEIASHLDRTLTALEARARKLGVNMATGSRNKPADLSSSS